MAKRKKIEVPIYDGEITDKMLDVLGAADDLKVRTAVMTRMFYHNAKEGDGLAIEGTGLVVTPDIADEVWETIQWDQ